MAESALIEQLQAANALTVRLGAILSLDPLVRELAKTAQELARSERAVVMLFNDENATLTVAAITDTEQVKLTFSIFNQEHADISAWLRSEPFAATSSELA